MNAIPTTAYRCGTCGAGPYETEQIAHWCCVCQTCGTPKDKRSWCRPCADARNEKRDAEAFAKATKVALDNYGHTHVYWEGHGDEGYVDVDSIEDELAELAHAGYAPPAYVWGCSDSARPSFCVEDEIRNRLGDEHHESVVESVIDGGDEVTKAQALIDQALMRGHGFVEDRSVAVMLPAKAEAAK